MWGEEYSRDRPPDTGPTDLPDTVSNTVSVRTGSCAGGTDGGIAAGADSGGCGCAGGVRPADGGRATKEGSWALGEGDDASIAGRGLEVALDGRSDILEALHGRSDILEALHGRSEPLEALPGRSCSTLNAV